MPARRSSLRPFLATLVTVPTALMGLLLASAVPAQAAPEVFREKFSGLVVEAQSFSAGADECVLSNSFLFADDDTVEYGNFSFNQCTGQEIVAEFGSAAPTVFDVSKKLTSAHVVADIPLIDPLTGDPSGEVVSLDVTFTGDGGRAVHTRESFSAQLPGEYRFTSRTVGRYVDATVDGFGTDVEMARIGRVSSMFTSLVHDPSEL